ncbi:MAG: YihY/virulence factor BrkB family protein [Candidatus Korobacteraceae bacterium]
MRLQACKRVIVGVSTDIANNHIVSFAAALSYYFVMAFFPALISLAAIVAFLPIPNLFNTIISTMARVLPPESMGLVPRIASDVISPSRGALLSAGLLGTLWTCNSGFSAVIEALNVAYDVPETRPVWKTRLLALRLTFMVGTLVTVAFALMIVGPEFGEFLAASLGLKHVFAVTWPVLRYLLAVSFIVVAIEWLYFMAPNIKQRFTSSLPGAIVAVVGWIFLSDALSLYFRKFAHLNRTYGVLGGGVALLTWLYWSGFLILLGAELNSEIIQQRGDGAIELKQPAPRKEKPVAATTADAAEPVTPSSPVE